MAGGMSPDDARREAERRFGDVERTRERLADDRSRARRTASDAPSGGARSRRTFATRCAAFGSNRGFAAAVILTLGLGIGANATMFGIVDRLLFRPPTYPHRAGRVRRALSSRASIDGKESAGGATPATSASSISRRHDVVRRDDAVLTRTSSPSAGGEVDDEMTVGAASADLWKMFDVKPGHRPLLHRAEDAPPNGTQVAVLSYAFLADAVRRPHATCSAQSCDIGPAKYTVIGVAPARLLGDSALETAGRVHPDHARRATKPYAERLGAVVRTKYCHDLVRDVRAPKARRHARGRRPPI